MVYGLVFLYGISLKQNFENEKLIKNISYNSVTQQKEKMDITLIEIYTYYNMILLYHIVLDL